MKALAKQKRTGRGFAVVEFKDIYGHACSLQVSSLADRAALWLGVDDVEPKVMAVNAAKIGVKTDETCGWVKYPVPEEVMFTSRMHLDRKQVEALIDHLQQWLRTGEFQ